MYCLQPFQYNYKNAHAHLQTFSLNQGTVNVVPAEVLSNKKDTSAVVHKTVQPQADPGPFKFTSPGSWVMIQTETRKDLEGISTKRTKPIRS